MQEVQRFAVAVFRLGEHDPGSQTSREVEFRVFPAAMGGKSIIFLGDLGLRAG